MAKKKKHVAPDYIVYTDGGCAVNPGGPGGIGVVVIDPETGETQEISQGYVATTNNRMEIMAVLAALESLPNGVGIRLYSDSQYVINCMEGNWDKKKNRDLWQKVSEAEKGKRLDLRWVRGHNGNQYNERCDELATMAICDQTGHICDEGYEKQKAQERGFYHVAEKKLKKNGTGGVMAAYITLPDGVEDCRPDIGSIMEYAAKKGIHDTCARCIRNFYMSSRHSFKDYIALKTGGIDKLSRVKEESLIGKVENGTVIMAVIREHIADEKDVLTAMRWHARGLTVRDSIRKVLVDNEVRDNIKNR